MMVFKSFLQLLLLLTFQLNVFAQVIVPFALIGYLDDATKACDEYNCGGTLLVNGFTVTVPQNTVVQFPAAWIPWRDLVDSKASLIGSEVSITGNTIDGTPIAGLIDLGQPLLNGGIGRIESINYADGAMKLVGGPVIRINDPNARYSKGYTADPFFTADDENPSISAFSGFPMCIPRVDPAVADDPLCPRTNRPTNTRSFRPPNVLNMVPFAVGDEIEFSGIKRGSEYICYSIVVVNLEITTNAAFNDPVYIRVEEALIGVFDASTNTEFADIRFIGFVSDPSSSVSINAIDVDPCTGEETYREIGQAVPKDGDDRNKWEFRIDNPGVMEYTREYRVVSNTGSIQVTQNGILAGQYVQPVSEWIFPEVDSPGNPLPIHDFGNLAQVFKGWSDGENSFGPLNPWPGPAGQAPAALVCPDPDEELPVPDVDPVADAGTPVTSRPGTVVTLSGVNTADGISNAQLTFLWEQILPATPALSLTGANTAKATFVAPASTSTTAFSFRFTTALKGNATRLSTDTLQVTIDPTKREVLTLDTYTWTSSRSGTISIAAHTDVVNSNLSKLRVTINAQEGGGTFNMVALTNKPGYFTYSARDTERPTSITIFNSLDSSSTLVVTQPPTAAKRRRNFRRTV